MEPYITSDSDYLSTLISARVLEQVQAPMLRLAAKKIGDDNQRTFSRISETLYVLDGGIYVDGVAYTVKLQARPDGMGMIIVEEGDADEFSEPGEVREALLDEDFWTHFRPLVTQQIAQP